MTEHERPDRRAEWALRDGLRTHAEQADFRPLYVARVRRPSWTRWLPAAAAILLVAVIAIPLLIGRLAGSGGTSAVPMDAPRDSGATAAGSAGAQPTAGLEATPPAAAPGWRWESYRSLMYQVPAAWEYDFAPGTAWCATGTGDVPSDPFVDVAPETVGVNAIACPRDLPAKRLTTFVTVRPASTDRGWDLPSGWKSASIVEGGYRVEVVHPSAQAQLAVQIISTVQPLSELDGNGCPAVSPFSTASPSFQTLFSGLARASVCQYDLRTAPALLASRSLDALQAAGLRATLDSAPAGSGPDETSCTAEGDTAVLVRLWGPDDTHQDVLVRYSGCSGNGIVGLGEPRRLTSNACTEVMQLPIAFTRGHGKAARLCIGEEEEATPTPGPTKTR